MKKLLLSAFVAFAMLASTKTLAQQGFGTNTPDKSAAVDIVSSQRGLLVPRLDLTKTTGTNNNLPVQAPAHGLLVYNKANTISSEGAATGVEPGFYYWERINTTDESQWQGKWVRIISTNTEKITKVIGGSNVKVVSKTDALTTTHTVSVEGGNEGQVLVTILNPSYDPLDTDSQQYISDWVNPEDFISSVLQEGNAIDITKDSTTGKVNVKFDGNLTEDTTIATGGTYDLAITGLPTLTTVGSEKVMVMDTNGILKQVSLSDLLAAKDLTLGDGLNFEAGITGNDGVGAVLKATKIEIGNKSVGSEKLNPGSATPGQIATVVQTSPGVTEVRYDDATTAIGKTLTTDGIINVGADSTSATASSLNGAVLTPTYLKIKDNSITALQIGTGAVGANELASGAVTADKLSTKDSENGTVAAPNTVPVANSNGTVTYKTVAEASGHTLTTDGKITVLGGTTANTMDKAVLVPTSIAIAPESITSADILNGTIESADIKDGTIQATDIQAPGSTTNEGGTGNQVLVTNVDGDVTWIDQSALPSNTKMDAGLNTTVSGSGTTADPFEINVATASGTTLGVVKEAATNPTVNINASGELSVNTTHLTLSGDVTGPLNATKVGAIQGTAVSATPPTSTNNVLKYVEGTGGAVGEWVPSQLQGTDVNGATLSSTSITVSTPANKALLQDLNIEIKPGTAANQILTTVDNAGALTTTWASPNSLVTVDNGLNKDNTDIELGGKLKRATVIETGLNSVDQLPANTLAINGLINVAPKDATKKNKVIVAETTDGILRTVDKVIVVANVDIATDTNYSFYAPEVVISVTLANNDQTIIFPSAASAEGQVINVKIANKTEAHTGYLYLGSDDVTPTPSPLFLGYGSMPYQSWIVKSNGTSWEIVGRN